MLPFTETDSELISMSTDWTCKSIFVSNLLLSQSYRKTLIASSPMYLQYTAIAIGTDCEWRMRGLIGAAWSGGLAAEFTAVYLWEQTLRQFLTSNLASGAILIH